MVASGLRGWGEMGVIADKYGVSFWSWWKYSNFDCDDWLYNSMNKLKATELYTQMSESFDMNLYLSKTFILQKQTNEI